MWNEPDTYFQLAAGIALFGFGWWIFRFGITAVGFGLGFVVGFSLYNLLHELAPVINPDFADMVPNNMVVIVIFSAVFGFFGTLLARRSYTIMVFISVFAGIMYILYSDPEQQKLVDSFFEQVGVLGYLEDTLGNAWYAILALLVAFLILYLEKQVVIVLSACVGSYLIASGINIPILFLPLCFIGYLIQQKQSGRLRKSED